MSTARMSSPATRAVAALVATGAFAVLTTSCAPPPGAVRTEPTGTARNIIFVNGDGMAAAHREAGFANEEMFQQKPEGQGDVYSPVVNLPTMTRKALDTLDDAPNGFFLFVEEEAVDEFAHNNNGPRVLQSMRSLDATVGVLRRYVADHPDTLLVVTGDHECGGLTLESPTVADDETGDAESVEDGPFPVAGSTQSFVMDWTTTEHTDVPVPVTAERPGADRFTGEHPNTYVHDVLSAVLTPRS